MENCIPALSSIDGMDSVSTIKMEELCSSAGEFRTHYLFDGIVPGKC